MNVSDKFKKAWESDLGRLKIFMAMAWCAVFVLGIASYTSALQQRKAVQTVLGEAGPSLIAAQQLKVNLEHMHAAFAKRIASDGQADDLDRSYADARKSVAASLLQAARNIHFGAAEEVPIGRLVRVLQGYQSCVSDALKFKSDGNMAAATDKAVEANQLMDGYLLPEADQLDEANTDALNNAYAQQEAADKHDDASVLLLGGLLLIVLVFIQARLYTQYGHVRVNKALAVATILTVGFTLYACHQFVVADKSLSQATELVLPRLHIMWRAEAKSEQARSAMLLKELPGKWAAHFQNEMSQAEGKVLSLPDGTTASDFVMKGVENRALAATTTGYLPILKTETGTVHDASQVANAIVQFDNFTNLSRGGNPYQAEAAFSQSMASLQEAKKTNAAAFDLDDQVASGALAGMDWLAIVVSLVVAGCVLIGLRARMSDYSA